MNKKNQSNYQSSSCASEDNDSVIEEVESSRRSFEHIVLLDGIILKDEVEVLPGVRLVPCLPSLGRQEKEIPRYVSEWAPLVGGIGCFFDKTRVITDSSMSVQFNLDQFCDTLSLACNSAVQIASYVAVRKDDAPFDLVPYHGSTGTRLPRDATKDSEIEEAKRLYELLDNLAPDVRRKLHIPINRWIKSHAEQSAMYDRIIDPETSPKDIPGSPTTRTVDKMIDLGIAFESLYLSGCKNLSRKFRRRASWFLKKDETHWTTLKEKFEKIYDLRCEAVHEGKLPKDVEICEKPVPISEFIKQAQGLCRQSILRIIKDGQFPDWAKIHIPDC